MINDKFFNLFNESLKAISVCPVCNNRYNPMEVRILVEKDNAHLIGVKCRNCQTVILAVILANNLGISSVGLITDLDIEEVLKFDKSEPVTYNDVIDIHQLLVKERVLINRFI